MQPVREVALLIETSRGYGRQLASGIAKYASLHGPWSFVLSPGDFKQVLPDLSAWHGNGIIARLETHAVEHAILHANLPTIALDMNTEQLAPGNPLSRFTNLSVDSEAAARLAADHLLERDYNSYAFVGVSNRIWSQRRERAFVNFIRLAGQPVAVYPVPTSEDECPWEVERPLLAQWLTTLPGPVGIMASNDVRGRQVLDACHLAELEVPNQVAVVGVDNDELFCELAHPTLSSVALNGAAGGYAAAERLDLMMQTGQLLNQPLSVQPLRVVQRQSTSHYGIADMGVVAALNYIQQSKGTKITVDDVAEAAKLTRRELDTRFRESLGRTVIAEIQRTRLDYARRLLEETDHPIPRVADLAGYSSASYMVQVFRLRMGTTPAKYRKSIRAVRH